MRRYYYTAESVGIGHPDKVADQISDAILDSYLAKDPHAKVACETFVTTNTVIIGGEVSSTAYVDCVEVAKNVIKEIGYVHDELNFSYDKCNYFNLMHEQSQDIRKGVELGDDIGAGDQGIMIGYATDETEALIPAPIYLAHRIMETVSYILKEGKEMTYLYPDGKCQVTFLYEDGRPLSVKTVLISLNHKAFNASDEIMQKQIARDVKNVVFPYLFEKVAPEVKKFFNESYELLVNPTGRFTIGGPHADTGLTGRKIIVDTYGGSAPHGGGAFSGKDPTKVDRSSAYAARYIAKSMVAAGISKKFLIQISYAIGIPNPISVHIDTMGTLNPALKEKGIGEKDILEFIKEYFPLKPAQIIKELKLRYPIYFKTATFGHFGRKPHKVKVQHQNDRIAPVEIHYFPWEELDKVELIKNSFDIKTVKATP